MRVVWYELFQKLSISGILAFNKVLPLIEQDIFNDDHRLNYLLKLIDSDLKCNLMLSFKTTFLCNGKTSCFK